MKKYVYLFELDSVRKTDKEIEIGQKALYDEIVGNGNIVVLTYNQLVDSRGFFSLLNNNDYYKNLILLFKNGSIRISQYDDMRTIVQYLICALDYNRSFIFSGWPLKSTQKRLVALIKRSLIYSDLTEIKGYIDKYQSKFKEIFDLFIEVEDGNQKQTTLNLEQCKNILENLFCFLKTVLRLSSMHNIYIYPKPKDEYEMSLPKFIHHALMLKEDSNDIQKIKLWNNATVIIKSLKSKHKDSIKKEKTVFDFDKQEGSSYRSDYHHAIKSLYTSSLANGENPDIQNYQYAEAIIDICYNYHMEYSICNVSKHYNLSEFASEHYEDWITFKSDFFGRLAQVWNIDNHNQRYLIDETNEFNEFLDLNKIPNFSEAVRIINYERRKNTIQNPYSKIYRYEYEYDKGSKEHKKSIWRSIINKFLLCLLCFFIALFIEYSVGEIQDLFDDAINTKSKVWRILEIFIFLVVTEIVTTCISKRYKNFLSFSDAISQVKKLMLDAFHLCFKKYETYCNRNLYSKMVAEDYSQGVMIDYVKTNSIKRYNKLRNNIGYNESEITIDHCKLFEKSEIYPIADTNNSNVLRELLRLEELYDYQFGIVYESKYNQLIVDPIVKTKKGKIPYFPYERVVPTAGNGIVMVTVCNDKLILLLQYRHASRRIHLSFPRGYGESGILSNENAKKELKEELHVSNIIALKKIGAISPDSGLTSSCADVYLVEIDDYTPAFGHEGIIGVVECDGDKFEEMLYKNIEDKCGYFDDGFTIAAYMLYKKYLEN